MVLIARWLRTTLWRIAGFADHARWIVLSLVLALAGVVGVFIPLPPALNVVLAGVSLVLLVMEIRGHNRRLQETQFVDRTGDDYVDVRQELEHSSRFEFVATTHGHMVIDWLATRAIVAGDVTGSARRSPYVLPRELSDAGVAFRRRRVAGRATYNGHLLGLNSDLGHEDTLTQRRWELVPARYWDHLASDILATKDVLRRGRLVLDLGRALYVDRKGALRDFGASWLLNGIGTSVVALTSDARLVVVAQSNRNESSQGLLAPSGSGSLEPADFRGRDDLDLADLARNGALRELHEEASITEHEVVDTAFLGFARWLEKAAKPELFTVALLSIDSHEVRRRRVPTADRPYTLAVDALRLSDAVLTWDGRDPHTMLEEAAVHRLSLPLQIALLLLSHAARDPGSPANPLVLRALAMTTIDENRA